MQYYYTMGKADTQSKVRRSERVVKPPHVDYYENYVEKSMEADINDNNYRCMRRHREIWDECNDLQSDWHKRHWPVHRAQFSQQPILTEDQEGNFIRHDNPMKCANYFQVYWAQVMEAAHRKGAPIIRLPGGRMIAVVEALDTPEKLYERAERMAQTNVDKNRTVQTIYNNLYSWQQGSIFKRMAIKENEQAQDLVSTINQGYNLKQYADIRSTWEDLTPSRPQAFNPVM